MKLIQINHNPSKKDLRVFGAIWLVFFAIIGGVLQSSVSGAAPYILYTIAIGIPVIGWFIPAFMRVVYVGMTYAAFPIGFVVSHLILGAVYYLVMTPIGLLLRIFGYDSMGKKLQPEASSYWIQRKQAFNPKQILQTVLKNE